MRVQLSYAFVAVLLSSSACLLTGCTNHEENEVETLPHSAGLEGDDGPGMKNGDGQGGTASPPLAKADDIRSSTPADDDSSDGGTVHDPNTNDAGSDGETMQCNALARHPSEAPYSVQFGGIPDMKSYSGGVIQDGTYVLTEDRKYAGQPGGELTGTSWTTLNVKGKYLTAVVTDHRGGEVRFNALIERDGSRFYLTHLCGLESTEWRDLRFQFIKSGYTATDDTLSLAWMMGNHAAVSKEFQRVQEQEPHPTL